MLRRRSRRRVSLAAAGQYAGGWVSAVSSAGAAILTELAPAAAPAVEETIVGAYTVSRPRRDILRTRAMMFGAVVAGSSGSDTVHETDP